MENYLKRRKAFMEKLGKGICILNGAKLMPRNSDVDFSFRQNSDFIYLCGFNEPESVLIMSLDENGYQDRIVVPPKDKVKEIWDGKRQGVQGAVTNFGISEAFSNEDLDEVLKESMEGHTTLFYEFNRDTALDQIILDTIEEFQQAYRRNPVFPQNIRFYGRTLEAMRQIKDDQEMDLMRRAAEITKEANDRVLDMLKPGVNECAVKAELEYAYTRNGGEPGYGSIVASGANATILHYTENNDTCKDGDLLLIDSGCEYQFYTADCTRCYPVNGKFSDKARQVYQIVLDANKEAIKKCHVGSSLKEVHGKAVEVLTQGLVDLGVLQGEVSKLIEEEAYRKYYMHNTSHWLGMDVHDAGIYDRDGEPVRFEPGMVFTVEPGLYFNPDFTGESTPYDGIGVRIEDNILITKDGYENLTASIPKEIEELEAKLSA